MYTKFATRDSWVIGSTNISGSQWQVDVGGSLSSTMEDGEQLPVNHISLPKRSFVGVQCFCVRASSLTGVTPAVIWLQAVSQIYVNSLELPFENSVTTLGLLHHHVYHLSPCLFWHCILSILGLSTYVCCPLMGFCRQQFFWIGEYHRNLELGYHVHYCICMLVHHGLPRLHWAVMTQGI